MARRARHRVDGAEGGQGDVARILAVEGGEAEQTGGVLEVDERQFVADEPHELQRRVRILGDDLGPLVAREVTAHGHAHHAAVGGALVRHEIVKALPGIDALVGRVFARRDEFEAAVVGLEVARVEVVFAPAALNRDKERAAVARDLAVEEGGRVARRVVDEAVVRGVGAEAVEVEARMARALGDRDRGVDRQAHVIKTARVGRPTGPGVFGALDLLRPVLARVHVEDIEHRLVRGVGAHEIGELFAVG